MRTILLLLASGASVVAAEPTFKAVDVDTKVEIGYGVAVADVNGDKKPDILLADKNLIVWYENPSWTKHVMAEKLTKQDHVCIAAADLDGDGKAEVAVGAAWNPGDTVNSGAVFYLIPPEDRTQKWEPVELQHEPTVHRMRWVNGNLVVVPLHGRGNKGGEGAGVKILAYHKPADVKQPWPTEVLDETLHMTHNFDPVQWDNDAEKEMLIAGKEGVFVLNSKPLLQLSGTESGGAGEVRLGKLGNGKRFFATVEPMHGTNLVLYRETGSGPSPWSRKVLDSSLVDGHALACGDLAKSGSDQIVVGWRAMGKPGVKVGIKMFTAQDSAGDTWKSTLVDDNQMACEDMTLADLNGDGRLDIVAAGRATKNLKIYWNGAR